MYEPRLTELAEADLDELWEYIAGNIPTRPTAWLTPSWRVAACTSAFRVWVKTATIFSRAFVASSYRPTSSFTGLKRTPSKC